MLAVCSCQDWKRKKTMVPTKRRPNVIFLHKTLTVFSGCFLRCAFFVPPFVDIFDSITLFWNCSQLSKIHPLHNPRVYTSNTYFLQRCFIYTIDVDGLSLIPADELAPLLFHLLPPLCLVMVYLFFLMHLCLWSQLFIFALLFLSGILYCDGVCRETKCYFHPSNISILELG